MRIQLRPVSVRTSITAVFSAGLLALGILPAGLMAQDYVAHPLLTDKFQVTLGVFRSSAAFTASAERLSEDPRDIDFDNALGVDNSATVFNDMFRWKFGEKWSITGQYFSVNATGDAVLEEDVDWQDTTFRAGTAVGAGVKTTVGRIFIGRIFSVGPQHEFGAGLGIHNLSIKTFIEGEAFIDEDDSSFRRDEAETSQPLPNIGIW